MDFMDLIDEKKDTPEPTATPEQKMGPKHLTAKDPLDPGPVLALFDRFHHEIDRMQDSVEGVVVIDQESNEQALEFTLQCKALVSALEKKRKEAKEPYLVVTRLLDGEVKALRDRLGDIQHGLNGKIQPYLQEQERKRQEAQRKLDEERRREQARIDAEHRREQDRLAQIARDKATTEAKARGESEAKAREQANQAAREAAEAAPPAPVVVMPEVKDVSTHVDAGTARLKVKTVWKVTDFKALPPALFDARWEMIEKAIAPWINAQIKAGMTSIPGVNIYEETQLETRNRR